MSFFSGKVKMNLLFQALINGFKGIASSPWSIYFETSDILVIKSVGSTGKDKLFIKFEKGNTKDTNGNYITVTVAEDITLADGSIPEGKMFSTRNFYCHTSVVDSNLLTDYQVSVTADRIIIWLAGDVNSVTGISNLGYFGLMYRYSQENHSGAQGIGVSYQGFNGIRTVKDLDNIQTNNVYKSYSAMVPTNPGWGALYHLSPCIMANNAEGPRGELHDIYFAPAAGVSHGDEITVANKTYKVYSLTTGGSSFLPGNTVAVLMQ